MGLGRGFPAGAGFKPGGLLLARGGLIVGFAGGFAMQGKAQRRRNARKAAAAAARARGFGELRGLLPRPAKEAELGLAAGWRGSCWRRDGRRKRSYGSLGAAARIAEVHSVTYGHNLVAYACGCGWWHVGKPAAAAAAGELGAAAEGEDWAEDGWAEEPAEGHE